MTLLSKTDVKYTGVAQARNILEYLVLDTDKADYINKVIADVSVDTVTVTPAQAPAIIARLMMHINRVQQAGATLLSIAYTLKAITFVTINNITDANFTAVSPYFGVVVRTDNYILKMFGLDGTAFNATSNAYMVLDKNQTHPVARQWTETTANVNMNSSSQPMNMGIIIGYSAVGNTTSNYIPLVLLEKSTATTKYSLNVSMNSYATTRTFSMTTPKADGGVKYSGVGGFTPSPVSQGLAAKYEYGTNLNEMYVNGVKVVSDTAEAIMLDLSSQTTSVQISSSNLQNGVIEAWFINSKDGVLAQKLSNHLKK